MIIDNALQGVISEFGAESERNYLWILKQVQDDMVCKRVNKKCVRHIENRGICMASVASDVVYGLVAQDVILNSVQDPKVIPYNKSNRMLVQLHYANKNSQTLKNQIRQADYGGCAACPVLVEGC